MPIIFSQYRAFNTLEVPVTINRSGTNLPAIDIHRHNENKEINSIKVEIIDNKPLYIPLGKSGLTYKTQFKTHTATDFNAWYSVLGNDILKVITSDYTEFPVNSYWNVETISHREMPGSGYAGVDGLAAPTADRPIMFEYELEVSESLTDSVGRPRE